MWVSSRMDIACKASCTGLMRHTYTQVNYKNVMKQYNLGPNGGILTSLNLFATRFDQVRCQMQCKSNVICMRMPHHHLSIFGQEKSNDVVNETG